jgi:hypothetical protein
VEQAAIERAIDVFSQRSLAHGGVEWTTADVETEGESAIRLYRGHGRRALDPGQGRPARQPHPCRRLDSNPIPGGRPPAQPAFERTPVSTSVLWRSCQARVPRGSRPSSRDSTGLVTQSHRPRPELLAAHELQLEPLAQAGEQRRPVAGKDGLHDELAFQGGDITRVTEARWMRAARVLNKRARAKIALRGGPAEHSVA